MDHSMFLVEALGTADSVAEIGEQFAWLGCALRSSPYQRGVVYCTPTISRVPADTTETTLETDAGSNVIFEIKFRVQQSEGSLPNGQCCHDMFRNPVVVKGYPI